VVTGQADRGAAAVATAIQEGGGAGRPGSGKEKWVEYSQHSCGCLNMC